MRILSITPAPVHQIPYEFPDARGGVGSGLLSVTVGRVAGLPAGLAALVVTGDLQGREPRRPNWPWPRLLGEVAAEELQALGELGTLPAADATGVLLAGDFYVEPGLHSRGGLGDVGDVWRAFRGCGRWVAGVAGNHDDFSQSGVGRRHRLALLDGWCMEQEGLRVGGVGGIIGNSRKPQRRPERDYLRLLEQVLGEEPHVVVLHNGPDVPGAGEGLSCIREVLLRYPPTVVVCGHCHWRSPLQELRNGTQVLNVDGRVVVLCGDAAPGVDT